MKAQCDKHGCKEMLCGCPVHLLEDNKHFNEAGLAKDKWISKLLDEIEGLKEQIEQGGYEFINASERNE